jgi:hypothetical protein
MKPREIRREDGYFQASRGRACWRWSCWNDAPSATRLSAIRIMIQVVCTWLLVVLAASPFTAPFSTCDLAALLGRTAGIPMAPFAQSGSQVTATLGSTDLSGDAYSISPVVTRTELGRNAPFRTAGLLTPASAFTASGAALDASQARHGRFTPAAVLRL